MTKPTANDPVTITTQMARSEAIGALLEALHGVYDYKSNHAEWVAVQILKNAADKPRASSARST